MQITPVARIFNNYTTKFGIPRQSGLTRVKSLIVFEKAFKDPAFIKGIQGFSHLWLIWGFSEAPSKVTPTVRPPRLGGNKTMGVFATRSPFRPNPLGLTVVELISTSIDGDRLTLEVKGADMMNGTPIYDIKPYLDYSDSISNAKCGFAKQAPEASLQVVFEKIPQKEWFDSHNASPTTPTLDDYLSELKQVLSLDARPTYHDDPLREYGLTFGSFDVKFRVADGKTIVSDFVTLPRQPEGGE